MKPLEEKTYQLTEKDALSIYAKMMQNGCNIRLNSEAKRFCLTGDTQCG